MKPNSRKGLSDAQITRLAHGDRVAKVSDGTVGGLVLELRPLPSTAKFWRLRYTFDGKEQMLTLGQWVAQTGQEDAAAAEARRVSGRLTIMEARHEAAKIKLAVAAGENPALTRKIARANETALGGAAADKSMTVAALLKLWAGRQKWNDETQARREHARADMVAAFGDLPLDALTPAMVLGALDSIAAARGTSVRDMARRDLDKAYRMARALQLTASNPTEALAEIIAPHKTAEREPLQPQEVGKLLRDIAASGARFETKSAFRLQWLVGARVSEVCGLRWDELDLKNGLWHCPAERMKMGRAHTFVLSAAAIRLIEAMRPLSGACEHVFPHRDKRGAPMESRSINSMAAANGWRGRFSSHLCRHTMSTALNEEGYSEGLIELALSHSPGSKVKRTYDKSKQFKARRELAEQWAALLESWERGATVTPINAAKGAA